MKMRSIFLLIILLFITACSKYHSSKRINLKKELGENEFFLSSKPSLRIREKNEEFFEKYKKGDK